VNRTLKFILIALVGLIVLGGILTATGVTRKVMFMGFVAFKSPEGDFDPGDAVTAPDYSDPANWAALPGKSDPADLVPAGVGAVDVQGRAPADVFFIHPTGYLSGANWTSPMNPDSASEENTQWMMANQASAFNGCCNVYAPRYREASIFAYFKEPEIRDAVLGFAYADVARAFEYFLERYSQNRPFVLASHSQGTHHLKRLLAERIDGTPLRDRMVAAYAIGSVMLEWSPSYFDALATVKPCRTAADTGCVVHWDTFAEGAEGIERVEGSLCTNPLTWRVDEARAPAELNLGALPVRIPYNLDFSESNPPAGVRFDGLDAPLPGRTWAQCRNGTLFVADQGDWATGMAARTGNYHGLDYALFYMNIRENSQLRVDTWLENPARP